jgi:hypothetical protein
MSQKHVSIYLNDHLAGSVAALELLDHLEKKHAGTPLAALVVDLRADILADRQQLEALMDRQQIHRSQPRKALAWLAEKASELKLRMDDPSGGAFHLLEVFDALSMGIEGKRLLWRALAAASEKVPGFRSLDYSRLEQRAQEQRGRVEAVRLEAARAALASADQPAPTNAKTVAAAG